MDTFSLTVLIIAVILVAAAVLFAVLRCRYFYRHEHFVCPNCKTAFKPEMKAMLFSTNAVSGKIIRCPNCGQKDDMEPQKDR